MLPTATKTLPFWLPWKHGKLFPWWRSVMNWNCWQLVFFWGFSAFNPYLNFKDILVVVAVSSQLPYFYKGIVLMTSLKEKLKDHHRLFDAHIKCFNNTMSLPVLVTKDWTFYGVILVELLLGSSPQCFQRILTKWKYNIWVVCETRAEASH